MLSRYRIIKIHRFLPAVLLPRDVRPAHLHEPGCGAREGARVAPRRTPGLNNNNNDNNNCYYDYVYNNKKKKNKKSTKKLPGLAQLELHQAAPALGGADEQQRRRGLRRQRRQRRGAGRRSWGQKVARRKSTPQKLWTFSCNFRWIFSGMFQWNFTFQWYCPKDLSLVQWIFTGIVPWIFSGIFPMDVHVCEICCVFFPPEVRPPAPRRRPPGSRPSPGPALASGGRRRGRCSPQQKQLNKQMHT